MLIYPDNNIFVYLENNQIDINSLHNYFDNKCEFVYSYPHIQELLEKNKDFEELKKQRLKSISNITENSYLSTNADNIQISKNTPDSVLSIIQQIPWLFNAFRDAAKNFSIDRDTLINKLGIDIKRLNNFSESEVIGHIDLLLREKILIGFNDFIESSGEDLHAKINTIFNFLDLIGYWKDKQSKRSNLARMYDASHAFFASKCNYFLTGDKRARYKVSVAYKYLGIETKIISLEEIMKLK